MSKLSLKQRQWALSFHIISAALWTGSVISLLLAEWMNYQNPNLALNALDRVVNNIDHQIIIPAAVSSVLTATVLCWGNTVRLRVNWRLKPQLHNQSPPTRTDIKVDY